jgi:hypothetical protein
MTAVAHRFDVSRDTAEVFEIVNHERVLGCDAFLLTVDGSEHGRVYQVEWQFADCDDRMAMVRWAETFGDWCTDDLRPNDVYELQRFLECNDWLAERVAAEV